ncbi:hypothetical protein [Mesorhizobium sp. KR1-2]|uniref:hypothetical protein n=1 Tax=Mesorhizobium sp. KR1-2 TaxID=3156609 RepID=UPI0032B516D8
MTLKVSMDRLTASLKSLDAAADIPSFDTVTLPPSVQRLRDECQNLAQALANIGDCVSTNVVILRDLDQRIQNEDLVSDLLSSIEAEAEASQEQVQNAIDQFDELAQNIGQRLTDEIEDWFADALESLGDTLQNSLDELRDAALEGLEALGDHARDSILDVGNRVVDRIELRLRGAAGDVVEAAAERALTELAETMMTAQMGVMVTSAIGPYLPVVIALQPALPALQDALDIMRGGF